MKRDFLLGGTKLPTGGGSKGGWGGHVPPVFMLKEALVLYCTVLYCTVLYCTVLYCTVLYCTVLYYKVN